MEEHLWGLPAPDMKRTIREFDAFKPKSILRTSDVVHFSSHEPDICIRFTGRIGGEKIRRECRNERVPMDVAMFHHYRWFLSSLTAVIFGSIFIRFQRRRIQLRQLHDTRPGSGVSCTPRRYEQCSEGNIFRGILISRWTVFVFGWNAGKMK